VRGSVSHSFIHRFSGSNRKWLTSPHLRCDPRHGRIAGADEPRRPANARPGRQRGPCRSDRTGKSRDRSIPHERARNPFTSPVCPSASEIAARSPRMRAARDGVATAPGLSRQRASGQWVGYCHQTSIGHRPGGPLSARHKAHPRPRSPPARC
jgi:hypothetical protein